MNAAGILQIGLYVLVLILLAWPLGQWMGRIFEGDIPRWLAWLKPLERLSYRLCGVRETQEMGWQRYALAVLLFNVLGLLLVYLLQRVQGWLPLNPDGLANASEHLALNTAISFATNTNWQSYGGETTMSYLTQMLGLTVQNFVSAATGIAVLVAVVRGFVRRESTTIGNFWVDLTRSTLYVLLPLALILAVALASQGVVQTLAPAQEVQLLEPTPANGDAPAITTQKIARGPVASQVAIKQLGTNGGGFFNVNSAHPLENPTPLSNFLQLLSILLIPAALCFTFGRMIGDRRQGIAIISAMSIVFVGLLGLCTWAEQAGNPLLPAFGVDQRASELQAGGNMEGKEQRFGISGSALWATATTAASNGSVNSMHDSYTPLGGLVQMWLMQLGEVIFGGVGSGLYGMLMFALIGVFIAGLMIGRTPEYLGKKIESFEIKMAATAVLVPAFVALLGTAISLLLAAGKAAIYNPGAHGFSEVLYMFSSAGNNNGSAFAGVSANTPYYNTVLGLAMFLARNWLMIPVLAIAGSMAAKKRVPASAGSLPTHTPLFVVLLIGTVIVVGALTFVPALALGPVVEHLQLQAAAAGVSP